MACAAGLDSGLQAAPGCSASLVSRLSTERVAAQERLAYWSETVTSRLARRSRIHLECHDPRAFRSTMDFADMSSFALMRQTGTPHRAFRRAEDARGQLPRTYSILVNTRSPWSVCHIQPARLAPGDAMLVDSEVGIDMRFAEDFAVSHLKISESWLRQWVPAPGLIVGKRLAANTGWGGALAAFVAQLTPELVDHSTMPLSTVIDHVGTLLALTANEMQGVRATSDAGAVDHRARIEDLIRQRCSEREFTIADVSLALHTSTRTVHRTLARFNQTFNELLVAARCAAALQMLESRLHHRLTIAEISRRAGFADASHFSRTIRARYGRTPAEISSDAGRSPRGPK